MIRALPRLGLLVALALCSALTAATPERKQGTAPEAAMSEDVRRMHERLTALSRGEGSLEPLRVEFMDGAMPAHRSFDLEAGKLVSQEWTSPGSAVIHLEGPVADERIRELLRQLIAGRYWTFSGTRFFPDAPMFLFRFHYGELSYVDFRCDDEELRLSPERAAIRELFLELVAGTDMNPVPTKN